jgi:outer membrane protein assembly factor BamB
VRTYQTLLPTIVLSTSAVLCAAALGASNEEWPKWLGPNGTNISTDAGISARWPEAGPRKVWEQKVGLGYSSPIGFEGKIYLFSQQGDKDVLAQFDADSGQSGWSQSYTVEIRADAGQAANEENHLPLPLATPSIDGGKIYTYGGAGDLVCRNLSDGAGVWHLNVLKELGEQILTWNEASSPLVTDKFICVQAGKGGPAAIAVDKQTGKIAWKSEQGLGGYAAPILIDVKGTPQLIIFGGDTLYALNPATGKTIWKQPWKTQYDVNASTPIYHDGHLFISSNYNRGCMMLSVTPTSAKKDWENKSIMCHFQPAILDDGYVYANSIGTIKCMHWPEGKLAWESRDPKLRLESGGSLVRAGDKLIAMSQNGKLSLVQATPQGVKLISQVKLFDFGTTWSSPLIYHDKLYAMGKDTLVCLDIGRQAARGNDSGTATRLAEGQD